MPHIGVAMEQSLQTRTYGDAFMNLVARSVAAGLGKRQSIDGVKSGIHDATTAFSSWDNCMQASFCKWPVIAVIIIGGLIIASIIWCCARCLCCGLSCCCECFYCLKCCGNCCGCCDHPQKKGHKYADEPFSAPHPSGHNQGYQSHANMTPFPPPKPPPPQYATFESDKKDADSLPAMPSWNDDNPKKVMVEEDAVEMEPMAKPASNLGGRTTPTLPNVSPVSPAVPSPYGPPPGRVGPNGYMAPSRSGSTPQPVHNPAYDNGYGQDPYGSTGQGYGAAAAAGAMGQGRRTPHQDYNNGYRGTPTDQGYPQSRTPRPYNDGYGRSVTPGAQSNMGPSRHQSPAPMSGPGGPPRIGSPALPAGAGYGDAARRPSPGPGAAYGYASGQSTPGGRGRPYPPNPQRQYSATSSAYPPTPQPPRQYAASPRPHPPTAQRQYSADAQPYGSGAQDHYVQETEHSSYDSGYPQDHGAGSAAGQGYPASTSPIQNAAGFDFNSGYTRPSPPPASPGPGAQAGQGAKAYPGYRPYKPQGS